MKKFLAFVMAAVLILSCGTAFADDDNVTIYVNDQLITVSDTANTLPLGIIRNDTTLVQVRVVTEALGCNVTWDDATQEVVITNDSLWFAMKIGSTEVFDAQGVRYDLPTAPILYNDEVTMVPVRFISEQMGLPVEWNQVTTTVFINSGEAYKNIESSPVYYKALFETNLAQIKNLNAAGDFYGAEKIINATSQEELTAAQTLDPAGLGDFYSEKEITDRNLALMASGQPNELEADLAKTRAYLDNAEALYNKGMYYEAENALKDFYTLRTTPALVDEYHQLLDDIKTQIDYLPYDTLKDIKKVIESGDYYDAHARLTAFLSQSNLTPELVTEAQAMKADVDQAISNYERAQQVVGTRYVTNVSHGVNLHQKADANSEVLVTVPYGTQVDYVEMSGDFARVKYNNMYGYIMNFYLSQVRPPMQYSAVRYINAADVNIMGQPKADAKAEMAVPQNAPVGLIEVVVNGYARIDYNGHQGYVLRTQLRTTP